MRVPDHPPGLCEHILSGFGYPHLSLAPEVLGMLTHYAWPGNLRELRNMLERAVLLAQGKPLLPRHFPGLSSDPGLVMEEPVNARKLQDVENAHILKVIRECNGDKYKASESLGISLSSLYRKINSIKADV
jgi:DNA-binding NtrC family response regulator